MRRGGLLGVVLAALLASSGTASARSHPDRILSGVADDRWLGSHLRLGTPVRVV
jgi:hypothetical protein